MDEDIGIVTRVRRLSKQAEAAATATAEARSTADIAELRAAAENGEAREKGLRSDLAEAIDHAEFQLLRISDLEDEAAGGKVGMSHMCLTAQLEVWAWVPHTFHVTIQGTCNQLGVRYRRA